MSSALTAAQGRMLESATDSNMRPWAAAERRRALSHIIWVSLWKRANTMMAEARRTSTPLGEGSRVHLLVALAAGILAACLYRGRSV